jgi:HNH endonuclease
MTLIPAVREQVRQRAGLACEYCGVTEIDGGGQMTVDHYQPRAQNGNDDLTNLVYACFRCNGYKGDYWPTTPSEAVVWNPRLEPANKHMLLLADGSLHPTTSIGSITVELLHLNRAALVSHRLRLVRQSDDSRRMDRLEARLTIFEKVQNQQAETMMEYIRLLEEHKSRLELFLHELE